MNRAFAIAALAALVITSGSAQAEETTPSRIAVVGGMIVHPEREGEAALKSGHIIVIADGRIERILPESAGVPSGARTVDARGKWIIPGLIDAHVHFFQSGNPFTRPDIIDFTHFYPYPAEVDRNTGRIESTVRVWARSGVAAVADLGGPEWNFEVRERAREMQGAPEVAIAGPLLSTVSRPELEARGMQPIVRVDTPEEAERKARAQAQRRPDFLKFWFIHRSGDDLAAQQRLLEAVARVAREEGIPLVVHATELRIAKIAIRAGARVLAHSVQDEPVDEEFLRLARAHDVVYVPTLFVGIGYALVESSRWEPTRAERRLADPQVLAMMDVPAISGTAAIPELPTVAMENLVRVWRAGITVAAGSDAGNVGTLHGPGLFRELELMERSGLTPLEVLRAATLHGARMLGQENERGRLERGFRGDVVVLNANPLESTTNLSRIDTVIIDGRVIDPDRFGPRSD